MALGAQRKIYAKELTMVANRAGHAGGVVSRIATSGVEVVGYLEDISDCPQPIGIQAEVLITYAEMSALRRASSAGASATGAELIGSTSGAPEGNGDGVRVTNADGVTIDTRQRYVSWLGNKTKLFLDEAKQREKDLAKAIKALKHSFSSGMGKVIF